MRRRVAGVIVLAIVVVVVAGLVRPLPSVGLTKARLPHAFPGRLAGLAWPARGEAAVAVQGIGLIGSYNSERPVPIASVAKVMTAYLVLRDHPLPPGDTGPEINVGSADVDDYIADDADDESVTPVRAGERVSEFQALEALLLPSADNVATLLAKWDAGSEKAFVAKMNAQARELRLAHTHYADASGVSSATMSTAADQVRLAMVALQIPALAQIAAMPQARLPVAGVQDNLDALLGKNGVVGLKTGSTAAAGACFVFAAHQLVSGRRVMVVGAVLGQPRTPTAPSVLDAAFHASAQLLESLLGVLRNLTVGPSATLAWVKAAWSRPVPVRAALPGSLVGWPGLQVRIRILPAHNLRSPVRRGQSVGVAELTAGEQLVRLRLVAAGEIPSASLGWRVSHP